MNHPHDDEIETLLRKQFEGPVPDDGFSEKVMQRLPPRRRRVAWPLWVGIVAGAALCWMSLQSAPLLHVGWADWTMGQLSTSSIALLLAMGGMSLLASWWSVTEADG